MSRVWRVQTINTVQTNPMMTVQFEFMQHGSHCSAFHADAWPTAAHLLKAHDPSLLGLRPLAYTLSAPDGLSSSNHLLLTSARKAKGQNVLIREARLH